ncbi:MAG: squalene/phytoene synthase family protein [Caldilineaceae bacterium]|nr:squalene/phytoene synthase family protein [Caldilineaceae bacterium]
MQLETYAWETPLLSLAREAYLSHPNEQAHYFDAALLDRAYDHCASITAIYSRSFHLASGLLPREKRRAARALYAFCRVSDDIVDGGTGDARAELAAWRGRTATPEPPEDDLVAVAWTDARLCYAVPQRYAEQLLDGVAADLVTHRYATFAELAQYSYGVASTVGLMSMHIIGYQDRSAIPYAIKLGVALQVTNILRDVAEDWARGRLYLPLDDLARFDLTEEDIAAGLVTPAWRDFMRFQIERNRRLYAEAMPGIALLDPSGRFAIRAAAELYRAILDDIEAHDYDVFSRRACIGKWSKLGRLPGIWRRSRM